jgi:hypothetical protein
VPCLHGATSIAAVAGTHAEHHKHLLLLCWCSCPSGVSVPCVGGRQQFEGYAYPGLLTQHPTGTEDYSIRGKVCCSCP